MLNTKTKYSILHYFAILTGETNHEHYQAYYR